MNKDLKSIRFLDMLAFKTQQGGLIVKPYRKPTDHNNFLHFKSHYS